MYKTMQMLFLKHLHLFFHEEKPTVRYCSEFVERVSRDTPPGVSVFVVRWHKCRDTPPGVSVFMVWCLRTPEDGCPYGGVSVSFSAQYWRTPGDGCPYGGVMEN